MLHDVCAEYCVACIARVLLLVYAHHVIVDG